MIANLKTISTAFGRHSSSSSAVLVSGFLLSLIFTNISPAPANAIDSMFTVNESIPSYQPGKLDKVELSSVGSDSMGGLVDVWVGEYKSFQPTVSIEVVSEGSAMGAAALIEGTADLGPMAREMKGSEVEEFRAKYGFEPTQVKTALAGTAVYVAKENPITELTFDQLDAIFSEGRKRGALASVKTWAELGIKEPLGKQNLALYGSALTATTTAYFKQQVMLQGTFITGITETADVKSMLTMVATNPAAIGFGAVVTNLEGVKMVAIRKSSAEPAYLPTLENLVQDQYPLGRFLNVYLVREPAQNLEPATTDFLRFVLSRQGQQVVVREGFIPLPANIITDELKKLS